jgi:hypothetical protein
MIFIPSELNAYIAEKIICAHYLFLISPILKDREIFLAEYLGENFLNPWLIAKRLGEQFSCSSCRITGKVFPDRRGWEIY